MLCACVLVAAGKGRGALSVTGAGRRSAEVGIRGGLWYVGVSGSSGFRFGFIWGQLLGAWDFCDPELDVQSCFFSRIVGESEGLVSDTKQTEGPQPSGKGVMLF